MKLKLNLWILLAALVLVIIFSLSSTVILPYSRSSSKLNMYPYEGMENIRPPPTPENLPSTPPSYIPTVPEKKESPVDLMNSGSGSVTQGVKTEGFEGLQGAAYANASQPLDYFSTLSAGPQCEIGAYSNSKGYLCLDEKSKQMLGTRGGNARGV